ncbi:MAG: 50S ribosomal protein L25/general stress protein Ctc [Alphaproteobacteria bacterium 41-28]|nr:MAG: 50S ribosomal protein L25/general stress protein Ctc [Alphaproteobacteria bacterium 41-28]
MTKASHSQLNVQLREGTGKGASRALRREGRVPAVLYGGKDAPVHFSLDPIQLHKELHLTGFLSKIFEIPLDGKKEKALARAVQFHPVTDRPLHVDFLRVSKEGKITVAVPLQFINELSSPGIKRGGVLNILIHNLEIISDIDHIPSSIEIDLTGLEIQDTIHLKGLKLPEGVVAAHPERDNDIANIVAPTVMKKVAGEEEEAPSAETAEAATPEGEEA